MIKLTIRDAASQRVLSVSTIAPIHAQVPSDCTRPDGTCNDKDDKPNASDASGLTLAAGQGGRP
jgi:general secretion pathway protein J